MTDRFRVVVVGAGQAGLAVSRKLTQAGVQVQDFQLAELALSKQLQDSINARIAYSSFWETLSTAGRLSGDQAMGERSRTSMHDPGDR